MPDETNIQDSTPQTSPTIAPEVPVTDALPPAEVATDTPVSVVDIPSIEASTTPVSAVDVPAVDASSTPISEPAVVPAPVEVTPVDIPVVVPPVVSVPSQVVQTATSTSPDKFVQTQSTWRELLQKALAGIRKKKFDRTAKLYAYILKHKKVTTKDVQLYMLCWRKTAYIYLNTLIKQNQIRRVGESGNNKTYYEPVV